MKTNPDYPLPSGELGEDEIVCQLVYLPNRPEYWQALITELHFLATWQAWQRDDDKRGKDAAANWREAFELTIGCWRMTCLEQLQDDVAEILELLKLPQACCETGDYTDGDQYTDRVEDGEGDVPQNIIDAGYAEDAADWDGFDDYKCMIAHVTVNNLAEGIRAIVPLVDTTGAILGGVAALAGILAVIVGTGGLAIVFGIVAGIGATSLLYQAITDFPLLENLADKVDTNHDALVCAVYQGDGDAGSLEALNAEIDELFTVPEALILKNMNLGPNLKALYSGRYDQQDIADQLLDAGYDLEDFSCVCEQEGEFQEFTDFETGGWEGWAHDGGTINVNAGRASDYGFRGDFGAKDYLHLSTTSVINFAGGTPTVGDVIRINSIRFWYRFTGGELNEIALRADHDGGQFEKMIYYVDDQWTYSETVFSPPLESTQLKVFVIVIKCDYGGSYKMDVDDITLDFDYDPV